MTRNIIRFFLITGLVLALTSLALKLFLPDAFFSITFLENPIEGSYAFFYLLFSLLSFSLAGIYYLASRSGLKLRKWLSVSHCVLFVLFVVLFAIPGYFNTEQGRSFLDTFSLTALSILVVYIAVLAADILVFMTGWLVLLANLVFGKRRPKHAADHHNHSN